MDRYDTLLIALLERLNDKADKLISLHESCQSEKPVSVSKDDLMEDPKELLTTIRQDIGCLYSQLEEIKATLSVILVTSGVLVGFVISDRFF